MFCVQIWLWNPTTWSSPKERHHCPTPPHPNAWRSINNVIKSKGTSSLPHPTPPHPMVSRNPAYTGKYDIKTAVPCSTASLSVRADKGPEGTTRMSPHSWKFEAMMARSHKCVIFQWNHYIYTYNICICYTTLRHRYSSPPEVATLKSKTLGAAPNAFRR